MNNTNAFLPNNYEVPTSTGNKYMKFEEGDNKIRIISSPIIGMEYWIRAEDGKDKPKRVTISTEIPMGEILTDKFGKVKLNHFWALAVFNYAITSVQILTITQKSILQELTRLAKDTDWGDPRGYDIVISKNKTDMTRYFVTPKPPMPLKPDFQLVVDKARFDLKQMYSTAEHPYGGDPFAVGAVEREEVVIDNDEVSKALNYSAIVAGA